MPAILPAAMRGREWKFQPGRGIILIQAAIDAVLKTAPAFRAEVP
jgi:hypothetical protein